MAKASEKGKSMDKTWTLTDPVRKMKRAIKSMCKEGTHPRLCRVHLDESGDMVSTDSYRMFREHGAWNGPNVDIPAEIARAMSKRKVGQNRSAEIEPCGDTVTVTREDGTVLVGENEPGSKFVDYRRLFDNVKATSRVRVLRAELLRYARMWKKLKAHSMMIEYEDGKLIAASYGGEGFEEWSGRWEPTADAASAEGGDFRVGLNPSFVADALGQLGGDEVIIEVDSALKPVLIRDVELWEDGAIETVVMPLKLAPWEVGRMRGDDIAKEFEDATARIDITPEGVKATPVETHVETVEDTAEEVAVELTVELVRDMFASDGVTVSQARDGACIWVCGKGASSRKDELKGLGFKYGKSRKYGRGWWAKPAA